MIQLWDGTVAPRADALNVVVVGSVSEALAVLAKWPARTSESIAIALAAEMSLELMEDMGRFAGAGVAVVLSPVGLSTDETLAWLTGTIGGVAHVTVKVDAALEADLDAITTELEAIVTQHGGEIKSRWIEHLNQSGIE